MFYGQNFNLSSKYASNYPYCLSSERTTVNFCTNLSILRSLMWVTLKMPVEFPDWICRLNLSIKLPGKIHFAIAFTD